MPRAGVDFRSSSTTAVSMFSELRKELRKKKKGKCVITEQQRGSIAFVRTNQLGGMTRPHDTTLPLHASLTRLNWLLLLLLLCRRPKEGRCARGSWRCGLVLFFLFSCWHLEEHLALRCVGPLSRPCRRWCQHAASNAGKIL